MGFSRLSPPPAQGAFSLQLARGKGVPMKFTARKLMVFIILAAAVALAYQLPYLRYTFYQQMMEGLFLTDAQIGLIGTTVNVINTICYPIGGILAEKFKTKSLIVLTLAMFTVLSVWFAFTTDFVQLLIIHALFGFFGIATLWSAYLTAVRGLADESNQSKIFGFNEATRGVLQTICGFVFLYLMGVAASATLGFRAVMLFGAVICAAFTVLAVIFMGDEGKAEGKREEEQAPARKYTVKDVLTNPGVWLVTFLIMCAYVFWSMGNSYMTAYTTDVLSMDAATASTVGVIRSYVIVVVAGFLGGWLLDRFTWKGRSFLVLLALATALTAGVMVSSALPLLCVILTLLVAFIANIMKTTYWSTMGEAGIPVGMTALATGVISFICFMPDWIYPYVCGSWLSAARAADAVELGVDTANTTAMAAVSGPHVAAAYDQIFIVMIVFGVIGMVLAVVHWRRAVKLEAAGVITVAHHDHEKRRKATSD